MPGLCVKPLSQRGEGQNGLGLIVLAWSVVADHGHGRLDAASCQPPVRIAGGGRFHGFQQLSQEVGAERKQRQRVGMLVEEGGVERDLLVLPIPVQEVRPEIVGWGRNR